jgi:hypothetical protein
VMMPAFPGPHLVCVHPHFTVASLEARFNPSSPPNPKRWKSVKALNSQTQAF